MSFEPFRAEISSIFIIIYISEGKFLFSCWAIKNSIEIFLIAGGWKYARNFPCRKDKWLMIS
jgi:hypothetical protein